MPRNPSPKSKNVLFTCNNPPDIADHPASVINRASESPLCTFLVFSKEIGESGTPHYQGYIEFSSPVRWPYVTRLVGHPCHCEARRGSQDQAIDYVTKDDTHVGGPWTYGDPRVDRQGDRSDLRSYVQLIKDGATDLELLEADPHLFARYPHIVGRVRAALNRSSPFRSVDVRLFVGPPGSGKSKLAFDLFPDAFVSPLSGNSFWMDGYDGQSAAILDDFGGARSRIGRPELCRLLDGYRLNVPVKGGFTAWTPVTVILTSNFTPQEWYDWSDTTQWDALKRRFSSVSVFRNIGDGAYTHDNLSPGTVAYNAFWAKPVTFEQY